MWLRLNLRACEQGQVGPGMRKLTVTATAASSSQPRSGTQLSIGLWLGKLLWPEIHKEYVHLKASSEGLI